LAVVDRPTTTVDASGWTESPDAAGPESPHEAPPEAPAPRTGTNGLDGTGQALEAEEAHEGNEPPRRPDGRFEKGGFRRRALSQQAGAGDVPRIQELTRRLRDAERERDTLRAGGSAPSGALGVPTPGRVERAGPSGSAGTSVPGAAAVPVAPAPDLPRSRPALPPPPPFTLTEPTYEQFADSPDPLRDYTKAMTRFTAAEERHANAVRYYRQETARAAQADDAGLRAMTQAHWDRMASATADPSHAALVAQFKDDTRPITPTILQAVIRLGDQSAAATLRLLQTPGLLDELTLATYDRPVSPDLVALVQRRLQSLGPLAAHTGSATAPALRHAPRPPNPVRTAPDAPPRDLPGDDASLAEHAAAFHQPRRSRLRRDR